LHVEPVLWNATPWLEIRERPDRGDRASLGAWALGRALYSPPQFMGRRPFPEHQAFTV
jgi:hypothetical protein